MTEELIQGTKEWRQARCGSLGASRVAEALAKTKSGWGASRANVMADLIIERLTETPIEGFTTAAMQWGVDQEPAARAEYELRHRCDVTPVGIIRHPSIAGAHASPDGLVGNDGLLEIKCPQAAQHLETLESRSIPGKYETQILWQMACTGRTWCDFVSFHPQMPAAMQLFVRRVHRDTARIVELERQVAEFLKDVDIRLAELRARYIDRRNVLKEKLQASAELAAAS